MYRVLITKDRSRNKPAVRDLVCHVRSLNHEVGMACRRGHWANCHFDPACRMFFTFTLLCIFTIRLCLILGHRNPSHILTCLLKDLLKRWQSFHCQLPFIYQKMYKTHTHMRCYTLPNIQARCFLVRLQKKTFLEMSHYIHEWTTGESQLQVVNLTSKSFICSTNFLLLIQTVLLTIHGRCE